jgi:hypothetical protein
MTKMLKKIRKELQMNVQMKNVTMLLARFYLASIWTLLKSARYRQRPVALA